MRDTAIASLHASTGFALHSLRLIHWGRDGTRHFRSISAQCTALGSHPRWIATAHTSPLWLCAQIPIGMRLLPPDTANNLDSTSSKIRTLCTSRRSRKGRLWTQRLNVGDATPHSKASGVCACRLQGDRAENISFLGTSEYGARWHAADSGHSRGVLRFTNYPPRNQTVR